MVDGFKHQAAFKNGERAIVVYDLEVEGKPVAGGSKFFEVAAGAAGVDVHHAFFWLIRLSLIGQLRS